MSNSTHRVEVVPVRLEPHPNADRLSLARIDGYTCVVATDQWQGVPLGAYLPPDSVANVGRPEFAFLAKDAKADGSVRVRAKKLRGVLSFGLLVPAPAGAAAGDDVTALLGVTHYEPPQPGEAGTPGLSLGVETDAPPLVAAPVYDLEAGRKYAQKVFEPGEPVVVTEKVHGANARYVFLDGKMHCGSRTQWKREFPDTSHLTVESLVAKGVEPGRAEGIVAGLRAKAPKRNQWWQALDNTPALRAFCEANPGQVVYGEVYGMVGGFPYDARPGEVRFRAFDILGADGRFLDSYDFWRTAEACGLPAVPLLRSSVPFDFDAICAMAEGWSSLNPNHVQEGVVVKPVGERTHDLCGRVALKFVGAGYLERDGK